MPIDRESFRRAIMRRAVWTAITAGLAGVAGFFLWHAEYGASGRLAQQRRLAEIAEAQQTLLRARAEQEAMERRVAGLRGERIDRDQLDERARTLLNLVIREEIVIPYEPNRRLY